MTADTAIAELVTSADIARRLGVSRQRVGQLRDAGALPEPLGRLGNYIVWRSEDIDRWIAEREAKKSAARS